MAPPVSPTLPGETGGAVSSWSSSRFRYVADFDTSFLVLRAPALLRENQAKRDRLLIDLARQLGVEGEVDLTTVSNISAEGTDTTARFPVSQQALSDAADDPDLAELFIVPDPN